MATLRVERDEMDALAALLQACSTYEVVVGFPEDGAARSGDEPITNAQLAYIHEYGSPANNIPARPFLKPGVERAEDRLTDGLRVALERAMESGIKPVLIRQAFERLGIAAMGEVQRYMASGTFAPLKPATIRRKGSSRPLIDTGQLRQSVSYQVRRK